MCHGKTGTLCVRHRPTCDSRMVARSTLETFYVLVYIHTMNVGPCHHGMARLQVADGGTASDMEGSCEYIKKAAADSRIGVVLQLEGWTKC
jgi:hypothetical protein